MIRLFALAVLCAALFHATPARACLTRQLLPPPQVAAYLQNPAASAAPEVVAMADAFRRDKVYYDALATELCGFEMTASPAVSGLTGSDAKIMDALNDKWKKAGAALNSPQAQTQPMQPAAAPPKPASGFGATAADGACKADTDCIDYCANKIRNSECRADGVPQCAEGKCGCMLTCR